MRVSAGPGVQEGVGDGCSWNRGKGTDGKMEKIEKHPEGGATIREGVCKARLGNF